MSDALEEKVRNAPEMPGVYLMKDKNGKVIYVGKAAHLRNRVKAYWGGTDQRYMVPFLISRVHDVEFIVTGTEKEALILENNLIKEYQPRYNVIFRDDKTYFSIRVDAKVPFPRFQLVRRPKDDGARYFGPYPSSASAKETLRFLQTIFPLRTCGDRELKFRGRPCLEYDIKRCVAPCVGRIDMQSYQRLVRDSLTFLEGREKVLIGELHARMNAAAEQLHFEEAAVLRDRITALENTLEKQRVVSASFKDRDVFGVYREGDLVQVCAIHVRKGKIVGKKNFPLLKMRGQSSEILSSLLKQYYDGEANMPDEIIIPEAVDDKEVVEDWLSERRGKAVAVVIPKRGERGEVLRIAESNAESIFRSAHRVADTEETLMILARALRLINFPSRIECFDISNVGGKYAVGSMVTFLDGKPWKSGYRRFRIRTVAGADDYAMMYEVLTRRYTEQDDIPDLVVVDGGRGHLGVEMAVTHELGMKNIDLIALAKGIGADRSSLGTQDRVYLQGRKNAVYLSRWPEVLFMLQRVRDEAHRFAVTYHRKVKERKDFQSVLDTIPGIGGNRKKRLLTAFGDLRKVAAATVDDLRNVGGIGSKVAEKIYAFFRGQAGEKK